MPKYHETKKRIKIFILIKGMKSLKNEYKY